LALTSTERAQVRSYLGWSERFHQFDSALELALNAVDGDAEGLVLVRTEMTNIQTIDAKILGMTTRFKAAKVGTIELQGEAELGLLRSLGRQSVGRIATLLGVPVRADYFGTGGPDGTASRSGIIPGPGASNMLGQG
jgi:hypothetical protein